MRRPSLSAVLLVLLLVGAGLAVLPGLPAARAASTPFTPVTGNVTGPVAVATGGKAVFDIHATGGPAYLGGVKVGNLSWFASVVAPNTTNVTLTPTHGSLTGSAPGTTTLSASDLTQAVTIQVLVTSVYGSENSTVNLTDSVEVVTPYLVKAVLVAPPGIRVAGVVVTVALDGSVVGTVDAPTLGPNNSETITFRYATLGFSVGWHTFTFSLNRSSLVTFAGGATQYSQTFYVPGPPPNYTIWYVAGTVTFFGALFILATRVAARRRSSSRR
jgi:hypothetical protein